MLLTIKSEYCMPIGETGEINLFLGGEAFVLGYDLLELHGIIEDIFQKKILNLAYQNKKVKYLAMESCCRYDEEFLKGRLGFTKFMKKENSTFYYAIYSPRVNYKNSHYASELKKFYKN